MTNPTPTTFVDDDQLSGAQINAHATYQILRVAQLSDLHYDGFRTVTAGKVRVYFASRGVDITYPDPYADPATAVEVVVWHPFTYGALAALVEGLCRVVTP